MRMRNADCVGEHYIEVLNILYAYRNGLIGLDETLRRTDLIIKSTYPDAYEELNRSDRKGRKLGIAG